MEICIRSSYAQTVIENYNKFLLQQQIWNVF